MKKLIQGAALCFAVISIAPAVYGGENPANTTEGFGAGKMLRFRYTQSFDCVDQPTRNLDFDKGPKRKAENDPDEMQTPICQAGIDPTVNPPGVKGFASGTTDPLYVLVPMFSVDNDQNPRDAISCNDVVQSTICGRDLGSTLISLFGAVPEAFKSKPLVFTQCPGPGDRPGTCTMHASRVDLAPVLALLGLIPNPPTANVFVPTPNHSHVIDDEDIHKHAEWWQVVPVLVLDKSIWPPKDGSSGITSEAALKTAEGNGQAIEVPSNFFLFFGSHVK